MLNPSSHTFFNRAYLWSAKWNLTYSIHFDRFCRLRINCSYAEAGVKDDSRSAPIDIVADVKTERV